MAPKITILGASVIVCSSTIVEESPRELLRPRLAAFFISLNFTAGEGTFKLGFVAALAFVFAFFSLVIVDLTDPTTLGTARVATDGAFSKFLSSRVG